MKPSAILDRAAVLIRKRGHAQFVSRHRDGSFCIAAAIDHEFDAAREEAHYASPLWLDDTDRNAAHRYVRHATRCATVPGFNDDYDTTPGLAVNALVFAAKMAREDGR